MLFEFWSDSEATELSTTCDDNVFPTMLESYPCIPIVDDDEEDSDADAAEPNDVIPRWLMLLDADADADSTPEVIATFSPD